MVKNIEDSDFNVVVFQDGELQIDVTLNPKGNTVWLNSSKFLFYLIEI